MTAEKKKRKRITLVTGANMGLGFETCRQLAQLGYTVILTARDFTKGEIAANQLIERGLDVIFYELDVSNQSHMDRIAHQIEQQFGQLDVLVNNAAILYDTWQNAVNADLEVINQALRTNLLGPWKLSQVCIPLMKKNGYLESCHQLNPNNGIKQLENQQNPCLLDVYIKGNVVDDC